MMNHQINLALQVLPQSPNPATNTYQLVDKAIEVIQQSGLRYKVCPFETVIEGPYDRVMQVVKQAQEACYAAGAGSMLTYIKIQSNAAAGVTIGDKMEKYDD